MATHPPLPFQTWTYDKRESVFEILSKSLLKRPMLVRLLTPHEFTQIRVLDQWTRSNYFTEAKSCAQTELTSILSHGARELKNITMKHRARYVLVCKANLEEFLLELVRSLGIFVGNEEKVCELKLKLPLASGKERGRVGEGFDRIVCWVLRGLLCMGRKDAESLAWGEEGDVWFDQHLQEEVEMRRGMDMVDLVKGGVKGKWRRGWYLLGFFVGRK